jgi:hypothetical protein
LATLAVLAGCGTASHSADGSRSEPTTTVALSTTTSAAPGATATSTTPTTTTTPTAVPTAFHSVAWPDVEVPGSVCHAAQPIPLSQGSATIATPPGVDAGTAQVDITAFASVVYGDLSGTGENVAALNVWCTNTGGTADGQLQNSWVIFADPAGTLQVLATLTPQQPSDPDSHVPFFDDGPGGIEIQPGEITAKEAWYGTDDSTCCPTGQATTVWTVRGGAFVPSTTVQADPKAM